MLNILVIIPLFGGDFFLGIFSDIWSFSWMGFAMGSCGGLWVSSGSTFGLSGQTTFGPSLITASVLEADGSSDFLLGSGFRISEDNGVGSVFLARWTSTSPFESSVSFGIFGTFCTSSRPGEVSCFLVGTSIGSCFLIGSAFSPADNSCIGFIVFGSSGAADVTKSDFLSGSIFAVPVVFTSSRAWKKDILVKRYTHKEGNTCV